MRMSALERPEAPLARAACSQSTTRPTPRAASAYAMLTPLTPPPTMTTSAVSVTRNTLSCAEPAGRFTSGPVRWLPRKQRLAFVMPKIHDLDYEAIGRSLDCSAESARAHVFQALRKIRLSLNGHELPPAGGVERRASPAGPTERRGAGAPPSESPLSMERPR